MEDISLPLLLLARGTRHRHVQAHLLDLADDPGYQATGRVRLAVAVAGNPHLHATLRDRVGGHRLARVRGALLGTGTVTSAEAHRWFGRERSATVAVRLVRDVQDPAGDLARQLLERIDHLTVRVAVLTHPGLPREVRLAAATRVVSSSAPMKYLRAAFELAAGDRAAEALLRAAGGERKWDLYAPAPVVPTGHLAASATPAEVSAWLRTEPRTRDEALATVDVLTRPAAVAALARGFGDPTGSLGRAVLAAHPGNVPALVGLWSAAGTPEPVRKDAAVALAAHRREASFVLPLRRWIRSRGATDVDFAGRFYRAAVEGDCPAWLDVALDWAHLDADTLARGAAVLLERGLGQRADDRRMQHLMWSPATPQRWKEQMLAAHRAQWQPTWAKLAQLPSAAVLSPRGAAERSRLLDQVYDAVVAAGPGGAPALAATALEQGAELWTDPIAEVVAAAVGLDDGIGADELRVLNTIAAGSAADLRALLTAARAVTS